MQQPPQGQQPFADRSQRSVFVGNISYEISEDTLKQVFSKVGPVVHLRLVHDRETGKPKGYGFCEYGDQQTAESAIRVLNGYDLNGRPLRVDSAAGGERSADEVAQLQQALGQRQEESPYGPEPTEGKAPEAISRSVSSLPPERMFALMKEMKEVTKADPAEAKNMLISNPQLAYALLQAQVVMRIVEPEVALSLLQREVSAGTQQPFSQGGFAMPAVPTSSSGGSFSAPMSNNSSNNFNPPPTSSSSSFPGPPPQQQQQQQAAQADDEAQQAQLLMQVMQLSEEEIAMLPPSDREKVVELRNQLRQVI